MMNMMCLLDAVSTADDSKTIVIVTLTDALLLTYLLPNTTHLMLSIL